MGGEDGQDPLDNTVSHHKDKIILVLKGDQMVLKKTLNKIISLKITVYSLLL